MKLASLLRSSHREGVRMDRPQMKGLRYVIILRNSWSSVTFVGAGRACTALTFYRVWVDTIGIMQAAKEVYGWGLYMCFLWIEHNSILVVYPHEVLQMGAVFHLSTTMYGDVISDSNTSRAVFEELVHLLLEDVL